MTAAATIVPTVAASAWLATSTRASGGLSRYPLGSVQTATAVPLGLPGTAGTSPERGTPPTEVQVASVSTYALSEYVLTGPAASVSTARTSCLVSNCSCRACSPFW
jgi:hypothetical protein